MVCEQQWQHIHQQHAKRKANIKAPLHHHRLPQVTDQSHEDKIWNQIIKKTKKDEEIKKTKLKKLAWIPFLVVGKHSREK